VIFVEQRRIRWRAQLAVENDAQRVGRLGFWQSNRQARIVGNHRAHSDQDGVVLGAQLVCVSACRIARDPSLLPAA